MFFASRIVGGRLPCFDPAHFYARDNTGGAMYTLLYPKTEQCSTLHKCTESQWEPQDAPDGLLC